MTVTGPSAAGAARTQSRTTRRPADARAGMEADPFASRPGGRGAWIIPRGPRESGRPSGLVVEARQHRGDAVGVAGALEVRGDLPVGAARPRADLQGPGQRRLDGLARARPHLFALAVEDADAVAA